MGSVLLEQMETDFGIPVPEENMTQQAAGADLSSHTR